MHPTHRMVDGARVEGLSRHALHRFNGRRELVNLSAYADGIVSVGSGPWATWSFERFVEAVHDGDIVAHVEDGMQIHAYAFGDWTVTGAVMSYDDPKALATEMADAVDRLNGRPDTIQRFDAAVRAYGRDHSPEALDAMRAAESAVPGGWGWMVDSAEAQAAYRIIHHHEGGTLRGGRRISAEEAEQARRELAAYAAEWDRNEAAFAARTAQRATAPTVELYDVNFAHPAGPPPRDPAALRNEFPVEATVEGVTYPSLHHAFHALSILDDAGRAAVAAEPMGMRVPYVAAEYPERPEWPAVRLAVMTELLRAKFREHPDLADILVSTGDARIVYQSLDPFWDGTGTGEGTLHWMGRLLELVRAELALARSGVLAVLAADGTPGEPR